MVYHDYRLSTLAFPSFFSVVISPTCGCFRCLKVMAMDLFADAITSRKVLKMAAPMVRYSRLPFRTLVRLYDCDLCFTPMIVSSSFTKSEKARAADFTTNEDDKPLIVQFAASNATDLACAAELVYPHSSGVDLNCGCPQRWAMAEGYGSHLIYHPELVADMTRQTRNVIPSTNFSLSMKIRILEDRRRTVDLCQKAEAAGVSFITVHARTPSERHQPVHSDAYKLITSSISIPVVANGDICSIETAESLSAEMGVAGVMSARGLLNNPALFAGHSVTPRECVFRWIDIATKLGVSFTYFHHMLMFMLDHSLSRSEKQIFNRLQSTAACMDFLEQYFDIASFQNSLYSS